MTNKEEPTLGEYKGVPAKFYEDGTIRNMQGHWLVAPSAGRISTPSRAREVALHRRTKIDQATEGVDRAMFKAGKISEEMIGTGAGWIYVLEHAGDAILKTKDGRKIAQLGEFLGKSTGAWAREEEAEDVTAKLANLIGKLIDRIPAEKRDFIEGKVIK